MPDRFPALFASAMLALLLTLLGEYRPFSAPDCWQSAHTLRLEIGAAKRLAVAMHPDTEAGLTNAFTRHFETGGEGATGTVEIPLPNVDLGGFALLWKRDAGPLQFKGARVVASDGRTVREIPLERFTYRGPRRDFEWSRNAAGPETDFEQPFLSAAFPTLPAVNPHAWSWSRAAWKFPIIFAGLLLAGRVLAPFRKRLGHFAGRVADFGKRRPRTSIALISLLSVAAACHPVVFFGKSFVSPNNGAQMFFHTGPTVAGVPRELTENPSGVDVGATMNWAVPMTTVQHRAIFTDGEMPFWNRGAWGGTALLGQLQSMIGDPLHWLPLATGGSAVAWDLKFILARIFFAIGIGFLVWAVSRHAGVAILLAASAPWIGFFTYRGSHQAVFTMCYAPWILVAWLEAVRAPDWRRTAKWALLLIFADWWVLCSGTAKEASAMLIFLNLAGGLALLLQAQTWRERAARLGVMAWASVLFLLLSAPHWLVFLSALKKAFTVYDAMPACQIQPSLVVGLFDDLFYRQITENEFVFNPCANLLVLAGVAWLFSRPRAALANRSVMALTVVAVFAACFAFGVIPPALLKSLPFLKTIHHFDNTFSCVLIVLLFPLAALGLKRCVQDSRMTCWWSDWALTLATTALMLVMYFGFLNASHRVGFNPHPGNKPLGVSALFVLLAPLLLAAFAMFAPALRAALVRGPWRPAGIIALLASLAVIHFRHGQWIETRFDRLTFNPKSRFDLRETKSPSLVWLAAARKTAPERVIGFDNMMIPGVAEMYRLEDITGADALTPAGTRELLAALKIPILWDWRAFIPARMSGDFRTRLDFLNVRHYAADPGPTCDTAGGLPIVFAGDMTIYESATAWPRAFFTDAAFDARSADDVARLVHDEAAQPFAALDPKMRARLHLPNASATPRHSIAAGAYRLTANSTEFTIDAPTRGLAVLHESNSPGDIEVTVDGQPSIVVRANHAFRAVPIMEPGQHVVRFTCVPGVWPLAVGMFSLGGTLLGISVMLLRSGNRARQVRAATAASLPAARCGGRLLKTSSH